jgi:Xaa-Pro aminopeptidase
MTSDRPNPFGHRLATVQRHIVAAGLDALVVTNLINVRYLTGFSGTAGVAVVFTGGCVLAVDFRYASAAREIVAALPADVLQLTIVTAGFDDAVTSLLRQSGVARVGIEGASMTVSRFQGLTAALASPETEPNGGRSIRLVPTERVVERQRVVKDQFEIETFREAARRLSGVARRLRSFVAEGRSELQVAADIDAAVRAAGFERPAFETIVASGPNSARPHARPGSRRLAAGEGVVLDFGGVYDGYCVDLTRTLPVGPPAAELRRLARAVREAHAAAISAVRPGVVPSEIDRAARDVLVEHGLGEAFGHGTGHGLGLEVHEDPRISKLPGALPNEPVVPGMVFTIEPGAYVDGVGGVRIEDDVLVTADGCEVLTDVPIDL